MKPWLPVLFITSGALCAQDVPMQDGHGRVFRLFDLQRFRTAPEASGPDLRLSLAENDAPVLPPPPPTLDVASFLRPLIEPPLGEGDDLKVLGGRWLALLGRPAQAASLEVLLAKGAEFVEEIVQVEIQVFVVPKAAFAACCAEPLAAGRQGTKERWQLPMSRDAATQMLAAVRAAGAMVVDAPRIGTAPLQSATMGMAKHISYIKDFEVTRKGDTVVADPIVDIVVDGLSAEVIALPLQRDLVAVACSLRLQQVEQPIADYETTLAEKQKVTVQLPRVSGIEFEQTARLRADESVVFAAQKANGDYVMAIVAAGIRAAKKPK